jgi:pimeloyl-ACP methyl ester carboxylesterase
MVLNFDFSLNGIQDHNKPLFDSEKFRKNTVSREIEDLDFIISSFINSSLFEKQRGRWNGEIYLAGHSLGGAVSLMTAGKFPEVKKIALLASIAELDRNTEHQKKIWKEKGYTKVKIAGTGQELFLDYNYLKDKENNFPDNAILKHASELKIPVLIIHASEDMVVKEQEALKLRENIKNAEFHVIKHTGHTFSAQHPLKRRPETLNKLVKLMTIFFRNA